MTVPFPLGVRIYSTPKSYDLWVTDKVENFSYRMGVPGGMLDASFKFRRYSPVGQPDATIWTPTTSAVSTDNTSFKVLDAAATIINIGDRFWVYNGSGIKMNGDRFTVTGKSSAGGTTTVSYAPSSSSPIASGDTVLAKVPASFYDTTLIGFNHMIMLFNRIQVVDLRTAEICWEGRIEDPARESEKDTWTLGVLGTSVFASDIRRPMFYIDDQISSWIPNNDYGIGMDQSADEVASTLTTKFSSLTWSTGTTFANDDIAWTNQKIEACDMEGVGRVDFTYNQNDNSSVTGKMGITFNTFHWDSSTQLNIAQHLLTSASGRVSRRVGTNMTNTGVKQIDFMGGYLPLSGASTVPGNATFGAWTFPHVQAQRMDRFRGMNVTGADYPNDGVLVWEIVEDVLGRLLNGGHDRQFADLPYPGYVDPYSAYVDTSSTALMKTGWTFFDGVTAKEILDKICNEAQQTAYWAIWESGFNNTDAAFDSKCKFEFVNWPTGWGYMATSEDGLSEQATASDEYNYLWYQWTFDGNPGYSNIQTNWNTKGISDIGVANIARGTTISRDTGGDATIVFTESGQLINSDDATRSKNAGTIKFGRPISLYDDGAGRPNGAARMLDPWMIRPGKLLKIIDLEPKALGDNFDHGSTAPPRELDGTVFRLVGTEFDTSTGICTGDIDQPATWNIPNQIITPKPGKPGKTTYYR